MSLKSLKVSGLGKRYSVPAPKAKRAKNAATGGRIRRLASRLKFSRRPGKQDFWAVRNVSFSTHPGTILGVIGPNGAGKSTLLKILARVTLPTEGKAIGRGRVASLLELGAGLNPEYTARENIIMMAAMQGIPRQDALQRVDEILEFSGTGRFADYGLKHYSSGMYLRLAFSAAINMDPSILLADEVLAVGDLAFQEQCLERVRTDARDKGLTVLFVSHDMDAIATICDEVMWLDRGEIAGYGKPEETVGAYQRSAMSRLDLDADRGRHVNRYGRIVGVRLVTESGDELAGVSLAQPAVVKIQFRLDHVEADTRVRAAIEVHTHGKLAFASVDREERQPSGEGVYEVWVRIPANLLAERFYTISPSIVVIRKNREYPMIVHRAISFMAYPEKTTRDLTRTNAAVYGIGAVAPQFEWGMGVHESEPVVAGAASE